MADIGELVHNYYESPGIAEGWARASGLLPAELKILDLIPGELTGATILDIGVGPGRTTEGLRSRVGHYIGVDYSYKMLRPCRSKYPDADLILGDGRQLAFRSGAIDIAFFLYNAIDDMGHEDRLSILKEIRRVLRPGGLFIFAAHNRDGYIKPAYRFGGFAKREGAWATLRENLLRLRNYGLGMANHARLKRHQVWTEDYAIINDSSFRYKLLTYYMSKDRQVQQLEAASFEDVKVFDLEGRQVQTGVVCSDRSLHYIARKRS